MLLLGHPDGLLLLVDDQPGLLPPVLLQLTELLPVLVLPAEVPHHFLPQPQILLQPPGTPHHWGLSPLARIAPSPLW